MDSARFSRLLEQGAAAIAHARALTAHSHTLHGNFVVRRADFLEERGEPRLHGGSDLDASVIASVLSGASVCAECIARKTGLTVAQVDETLRQIAATFAMAKVSRCDACLEETLVHRLG